jgi:plastocyanin
MRAIEAAVAALARAAPAAAADRTVDIPGKLFVPAELTALVGDTVSWTNHDGVIHDIASFDDTFDSGDLAPGGTFSFTFTAQGTYAYRCTIHRFMFGTITVNGLAFSGPATSVAAGGTIRFVGLAPAGVPEVAVQRLEAGTEPVTVATVAPGQDGSFTVAIPAEAPGDYRAATGDLTSPQVHVAVGARLALTAGRATRGRVVVRAAASPSQAGAAIELQRYSRERFDWITFAAARLDRRSRAAFTIAPRRPLHVRAVIVRGVAGFGASQSRPIVVKP